MPDTTDILKRAVVRAIEREIDRDGARRGIAIAPAGLLAGNPLGGGGYAAVALDFATGYNTGTGETTTAFIFDLSLFNGPDILI